MREQMEKSGMSWSMWDMMGSGMGIYDEDKKERIQPQKDALLPIKFNFNISLSKKLVSGS